MKRYRLIWGIFYVAFALFLAFSIVTLFSGCEPLEDPPPVEYFTDITYEVVGTGTVEFSEITYGDLKYANQNYPDSLIWLSTTVSGAVLPWTKTINTCVGHPVKLSAISTGNRGSSIILRIYDDEDLVAEKTYESNGFLWGGILEYSIPHHD